MRVTLWCILCLGKYSICTIMTSITIAITVVASITCTSHLTKQDMRNQRTLVMHFKELDECEHSSQHLLLLAAAAATLLTDEHS